MKLNESPFVSIGKGAIGSSGIIMAFVSGIFLYELGYRSETNREIELVSIADSSLQEFFNLASLDGRVHPFFSISLLVMLMSLIAFLESNFHVFNKSKEDEEYPKFVEINGRMMRIVPKREALELLGRFIAWVKDQKEEIEDGDFKPPSKAKLNAVKAWESIGLLLEKIKKNVMSNTVVMLDQNLDDMMNMLNRLQATPQGSKMMQKFMKDYGITELSDDEYQAFLTEFFYILEAKRRLVEEERMRELQAEQHKREGIIRAELESERSASREERARLQESLTALEQRMAQQIASATANSDRISREASERVRAADERASRAYENREKVTRREVMRRVCPSCDGRSAAEPKYHCSRCGSAGTIDEIIEL